MLCDIFKILILIRYHTGSSFLGEGEAVLEPVDDERGGAPRRPRRRAEQERVQQRVSGPQAGAVVTALSANMPLLQHTKEGAHFDTYQIYSCHATRGDGMIVTLPMFVQIISSKHESVKNKS